MVFDALASGGSPWTGRGVLETREHQALIHRYGELGNQARDPLLPSGQTATRLFYLAEKSPFVDSLRGDNDQWTYPPMDYLFVYWMARANGQVEDH